MRVGVVMARRAGEVGSERAQRLTRPRDSPTILPERAAGSPRIAPPSRLPRASLLADRQRRHVPAGHRAARAMPAQARARDRARRARMAACRSVAVALIDNSEDRDGRRRRDQARQGALRRLRHPGHVPARPRQHRLRHRAQPDAARHRRRLPARAQSRRRARAATRSRTRSAGSTCIRTSARRARGHASRDGTPDFLCKRYPAVFDLFLRGFAPSLRAATVPQASRPLRDARLHRSRERQAGARRAGDVGRVHAGASARRSTRTGGFDPKYFLYFEDFDWSVRLNKVTQTAYLPSFRVVHHGGHAARKGLAAHLLVREERPALLRKHGWRWF